jgi:hypothetical protein
VNLLIVLTYWGGLQITNNNGDGIWSFMVDGSAAGIYDDQNGDWAIYCIENSYVELRHNGSGKLATNSGGVTVTGTVTATGGNSSQWNTAFSWGPIMELGVVGKLCCIVVTILLILLL